MQLTVGEYVYSIRVYNESCTAMQGLTRMAVFAMDTETEKLKAGRPIVPAFLQVCNHALRQVDVVPEHLFRKYLTEFYQLNPDFVVAMHNAPFDLEVLGIKLDYNAPLLQAVQEDRCIDTGIRYMLRQLSIGRVAQKWNLALVSKQLLGVELVKDEEIRLTFRPGMALTQRHLLYMSADAAATAQLVEVMPNAYATEWHQTVGFIALSDIGRRGMCVDRNYLQTLHREFTEKKRESDETLAIFGYYAGESGNQKVLQSILQTTESQLQVLENDPNLRFKRTEAKKAIQITDESLEVMGNREHPFINAYKESEHRQKVLSTYLNEYLVKDDNRVHPYFTPLVRTGRTSCRGPNLQNLPRKENIRGIYIPTPGWVLYASDYSQLELCALAESCLVRFGKSKMAEVINNGLDVHRWFAAQIVGKSHDLSLVVTSERQMAKACYSADTEFLTPSGWGRVDELYRYATKPIAQYCPHTKQLSFVVPHDWTKKESQELVRFTNDYTDTMVTPDHRMLRISREGVVSEVLAKDLKSNDQYSQVHGGFYDKTVVMSESLTRLAVMVQADGSFEGNVCRLGFSEARKIKRCSDILIERGIKHSKHKSEEGVVTFRFSRDELEGALTEDKHFLVWNAYHAGTFISELPRWDGHTHSKTKHTKAYFNTSEEDADIVQTILVTSGYKTSMRRESQKGVRKDIWKVTWYTGDRKKNPEYARTSSLVSEVQEGLHTVYCPTVPTSWVITRRNGKVCISGNCNFGFPGGLGIKTFQYLAKTQYGVNLSTDRCKELKKLWIDSFPEMEEHFKQEVDYGNSTHEEQRYIAQTITGRKRRNASFCSACNYHFQGLAADGARIALWYLWRESYRMVNFVHDEVIVEMRDDEYLQDRVKRIDYLMIQGMQKVIPHVKIKVEGALMRRWYKEAKPVHDEQGNLLIWEPPVA